MSCIDAPVYGPDGTLIAALDVSSARADQTEAFNRLIEGMVAQIAGQIEGDLFRDTYRDQRIIMASDTDPYRGSFLAVDGDEVVVGATRAARRQFDLELHGDIKRRPLMDLMGCDTGTAGLERAERSAVIRALTRADGNASEAARALNIGRATLYRRMKKLGTSQN